jgi:putative redox protein
MGTITTRALGGMAFESAIGVHRLIIDVPEAMGGQGRGPTPPELFVASLGSCVAAFVASYCGQHGIDASGLEVRVDFDKDAGPPVRLVNLHVYVSLPNVVEPDRVHQAALRHVAEHCPVHETIHTLGAIQFDFSIGTAYATK